MEFQALLFDTRSIQRYIYSSNHLRTNIGASSLVDGVFHLTLTEVMREKLGADQVDITTWKTEEHPHWENMPMLCRIGYIGGGNALVLFRPDVEKCRIDDVVTSFTKRLLETHPGLRTGIAYGAFRINDEGYFLDEAGEILEGEELNTDKNSLTALVHQLKHWQGSVFPETNVPYTGLTHLCPEIGEAATAWDDEHDRIVSWEIEAKRDEGRNAKNRILEKIQAVLSPEEQEMFSGFSFPDELNKLGQRETERDIAIVHIDGNNMGRKFAACKTLTERKNLSLALAEKTTRAFADMLIQAIREYDEYENFLKLEEPPGEEKKSLPLRPLVLGGDDLTFICTAKLALRYTKRVMEAMLSAVGEGMSVDTCAGISFQPQNYPFFRGYMLAEQACDAAKQEMRKGVGASCWLDFVVRHGEQAATLSEIRKQEYLTREGYDMHFGPYRVDAPKSDERALANLTEGLDALKKEEYAKQRLAMNKIKKLRDVVRHGAHEWEKFRQRLTERDDSLPKIEAWRGYAETLWKEGRTPYIDLIEMLDFYEPEGGKAHDAE